jgi:hypothetical protein
MGNSVNYRASLKIEHAMADGAPYYVARTSNANEAANLLARIRESLLKIMNHATIAFSQHSIQDYAISEGVLFLLQRFPNGIEQDLTISELDTQRYHSFAFNQDKTDMYLCIRKHGLPDELLADQSTVLYVALHELAHAMCGDYAAQNADNQTIHNEDFRKKENYLWSIGFAFGLLDPSSMPGKEHCGFSLPDPARSV